MDSKCARTREASTQTGYQHTPLQPRQIRLLHLDADLSSPDVLVASCEIVNLDERPDFIALSYSWGDPTPTHYLHLPHEALGITENLHQFLVRSLKLDISHYSMWIDAICVDQSNPTERSQQVKLMSEIYSTALAVTIWLGEETEQSSLAFDLVQYICFQTMSWGPAIPSSSEISVFRGRIEALENHALSRKGSLAWTELNRLLARPWFTRIWVLQEIVLSTTALVLCGSRHLPWAFFGRISFLCHDQDFLYYSTSATSDTWAPGWVSISGIELLKGWQPRMTTESFLHNFVHNKAATDHRDYIFGILGMCCDSNYLLQELDYNCSVAEVFTITAKNLCQKNNSIRFLDLAGIGWHERRQHLPSWVPDYANLPRSMSSKLGFSAALNTHTSMSFGQDKSLRIMGRLYEQIRVIGPIFDNARKLNWTEWLAETKRVCSTAQNDKEIFSSTLTVASNTFRDHIECYDTFLGLTQHLQILSQYPTETTHPAYRFLNGKTERDYIDRIVRHVDGKAIFQTFSGHLGICPPLAQPGDVVSVFGGSVKPHILRPLENQLDTYRLVGECYVHGIMNGEILEIIVEDVIFTII